MGFDALEAALEPRADPMILEVSLLQSDLRKLPAFFSEIARCFGLL